MNISILGCGWLGYPLAVQLIGENHRVMGSTTSPEKLGSLRNKGIEPLLLEVTREGIRPDQEVEFWNCDLLVLNIPPGRRKGDVLQRHPGEVESVIRKVREHKIPWVIFVSSTSVYSNRDGEVSEEDARESSASSESGKALLACESMLMKDTTFDTTVLRFGGLYGGSRHPVRYLAKRNNPGNGEKPVNLIHQSDAVGVIVEVIRQGVKGKILNAVSDEHPTRREFYTSAAEQYGLEKPQFQEETGPVENKVVSNRKLKELLSYTFHYPDPLKHPDTLSD
ncbi:MAG: SDR family oxidoreductase [Balneolaceae bacterium]